MQISYYAATGVLKADILDLLSSFFHIQYSVLVSNTRKREVVEARFIGMYVLKINTSKTLREIAEYFNKNHATTVHAIKTVENLMTYNPKFKSIVENVDAEYKLKCQ